MLKVWIAITEPTPTMTAHEVVYETTARNLALQIKGGLGLDDFEICATEEEARGVAARAIAKRAGEWSALSQAVQS